MYFLSVCDDTLCGEWTVNVHTLSSLIIHHSFPSMKEDIANYNCLLRFIKGFIVVLLVEYVIRCLVPISHGMIF